ncbi:MAG: HAD family phosphatase [Erysipelotrichaceae bacterium]|nr:HAD family phosphatase [Erysipelotrichaceae bacterium]
MTQEKIGKTLFASDYDGTLTRLGFMFPKTKKAIKAYRDENHLFCADTGRCPAMFSKRKMKLYDYIIGSSGARICDHEKNVIYQQAMDPEDAVFVLQLAHDIKARHVIVHLENSFFFARPRWLSWLVNLTLSLVRPKMVVDRIKRSDTVYQISINLRNKQQVEEVLRRCAGRNVATNVNGCAVDVAHKECSKTLGIGILQKIINADRVYTIGDELNDYEMLRDYEGFMIAHGNRKLEEVCKYKVLGIKEAIDIIMENERNEKPA